MIFKVLMKASLDTYDVRHISRNLHAVRDRHNQ